MQHATSPPTGPVPRAYPLPRPTSLAIDGPILSFGLLVDIADAFTAHGFPRPQGRDFVALRECVAWFAYASDEPGDLRDVQMPDGPPPPLPAGVEGVPVGQRHPSNERGYRQ
ncbi:MULTISPECIES: hypothetical protein [Micromonospora]|uniref:Uncharacterized protein n=1 Tax=Micromonospora tulbaghiae TaxID=479978 RepID=A0A386WH72_9ACTN|nr:hypothetical protein [Micromonospora tulbaghiae]AYF26084.1 hypothetical protein CSH63_01115 [Micromonospora tulbaghiae]